MPNTKSAIKALRQSKKREVLNKLVFANIRDIRRHLRQAIETGDKEKSLEYLKKLVVTFDKAVKKGIIKKNTASRKKSRATKKVNKLK